MKKPTIIDVDDMVSSFSSLPPNPLVEEEGMDRSMEEGSASQQQHGPEHHPRSPSSALTTRTSTRRVSLSPLVTVMENVPAGDPPTMDMIDLVDMSMSQAEEGLACEGGDGDNDGERAVDHSRRRRSSLLGRKLSDAERNDNSSSEEDEQEHFTTAQQDTIATAIRPDPSLVDKRSNLLKPQDSTTHRGDDWSAGSSSREDEDKESERSRSDNDDDESVDAAALVERKILGSLFFALCAAVSIQGLGFIFGLIAKGCGSGGDATDVADDAVAVTNQAAQSQVATQTMAVQGAQGAANSASTGVTAASSPAGGANSLMSSMANSSSNSQAAVAAGMAGVVVVAAVSGMLLTPDAAAAMASSSYHCGVDTRLEPPSYKVGRMRITLEGMQPDQFAPRKSELEDLFVNAYNNVSGLCDGPYQRQLQSTSLKSWDFLPSETVDASLPVVITDWVAGVACQGCSDIDPLFGMPSMDETQFNEAPLKKTETRHLIENDTAKADGSSKTGPLLYGFDFNSSLGGEDLFNSVPTNRVEFLRRFLALFDMQLNQTTVIYAAVVSELDDVVLELNLKVIAPSVVPSLVPSTAPSATPTQQPSSEPTATSRTTSFDTLNIVTPQPTSPPSSRPSAAPTPSPTPGPTNRPTASPTDTPTGRPTRIPTVSPTSPPTGLPTTIMPTATPAASPTGAPNLNPTVAPSPGPTLSPTPLPTTEPTLQPTLQPSPIPTLAPTLGPTSAPVQAATLNPTGRPTDRPTPGPTASPTPNPTRQPTPLPTPSPTDAPTVSPSQAHSPTMAPTGSPTQAPTRQPFAVVRFALVDAASNTYVPGYEDLQDGLVLDRADLPEQLTIEAITDPREISAVRFLLDGNEVRTEKNVPYSLSSDTNASGDFKPSTDLEPTGVQKTLMAVPIWWYGYEGTSLEISFSVIKTTSAPTVVPV